MRRNKIYTRAEATREGKLYFVFCEGDKKETTYFHFFNRIASQIVVQIVPIEDGKNSPMGLYQNACQRLLKSPENPTTEYDLMEGDEVWFIIDTDEWGDEIKKLREAVAKHENWFVSQSNPCFEVWLYYHFSKDKPTPPIENWKRFLNESVKGGFDNRKHPIYVESAIAHAAHNFSATDVLPDWGTTEMFQFATKILPLVKKEIDALLGGAEK